MSSVVHGEGWQTENALWGDVREKRRFPSTRLHRAGVFPCLDASPRVSCYLFQTTHHFLILLSRPKLPLQRGRAAALAASLPVSREDSPTIAKPGKA